MALPTGKHFTAAKPQQSPPASLTLAKAECRQVCARSVRLQAFGLYELPAKTPQRRHRV